LSAHLIVIYLSHKTPED
jgi:protein disulfide-isomerase A1